MTREWIDIAREGFLEWRHDWMKEAYTLMTGLVMDISEARVI